MLYSDIIQFGRFSDVVRRYERNVIHSQKIALTVRIEAKHTFRNFANFPSITVYKSILSRAAFHQLKVTNLDLSSVTVTQCPIPRKDILAEIPRIQAETKKINLAMC